LFDKDGAEKVAGLMEKAKSRNVKIVLPVDYVTGNKFDKDAEVFTRTSSHSRLPTYSTSISRLEVLQIKVEYPTDG
jgi:3-phosphoglycerate kinase